MSRPADRVPGRVEPKPKRRFGGVLLASGVALLVLLGGMLWAGSIATNTVTAPGYYLDGELYFKPVGGEERHVDAPGVPDTDTDNGNRVRVYFDPMDLKSATTHWYRVWAGPALVLAFASAFLLWLAGLSRMMRSDDD